MTGVRVPAEPQPERILASSGGKTPFSRTSRNPGFKPAPFDDAVVSELSLLEDLTGQHAMISLTTPQCQYIEHRGERQELYNWTLDPHEQGNLAAAPLEQGSLASRHSRLIGLVSKATGPWRGSSPGFGGGRSPARFDFTTALETAECAESVPNRHGPGVFQVSRICNQATFRI